MNREIKFCCGITTYNPSIEDEINLSSYKSVFDKVYIYDNSDRTAVHKVDDETIEIISEGKNNGLAIGLDYLCRRAKKDGFDYIMLLDQDSRISNDDLYKILTCAKSGDNAIGIYCPQIIYGNELGMKKGTKEVDWCITSGSLIRLSIYGTNVAYDYNYFIDRLDKDFCKQINDVGYRICQINEARLFQQLGDKIEVNGKVKSNHSALRHLYMSRNRWYYNKKFSIGLCVSVMQTIKHCYYILRFESSKFEKIKMVFLGINAYRKGRMGVYN